MIPFDLPTFETPTSSIISLSEGSPIIPSIEEWEGEALWILCGLLARLNENLIGYLKATEVLNNLERYKSILRGKNEEEHLRNAYLTASLTSSPEILGMLSSIFDMELLLPFSLNAALNNQQTLIAVGNNTNILNAKKKVDTLLNINPNIQPATFNEAHYFNKFSEAPRSQKRNELAWKWLTRSYASDKTVPLSVEILRKTLNQVEHVEGIEPFAFFPKFYPAKQLPFGISCDIFDVVITDIVRSIQDPLFSMEDEDRFMSVQEVMKFVNSANEKVKFIFVLRIDGTLRFWPEEGTVRVAHSELASGHRCFCAGEIIISPMYVCEINNSSGHFRPPYITVPAAAYACEKLGLYMDACVLRNVGTRKEGLQSLWKDVKNGKADWFKIS